MELEMVAARRTDQRTRPGLMAAPASQSSESARMTRRRAPDQPAGRRHRLGISYLMYGTRHIVIPVAVQ